MPSKSSAANTKSQDRRFKVGRVVWVLEDGEYHRGLVAELRPREKILVDFPDCDPTLCAQYDEWDENLFARKPKPKKPKKPKNPSPATQSGSKKRTASSSPQPPPGGQKRPRVPRGRRETGSRRAAQRQQEEGEAAMAQALLKARLDGLMSEEKRKSSLKAQEQAVASNLLRLKDTALEKTKEILEKRGPPTKEPVEKRDPPSIYDEKESSSGMKFTPV